MKKTLLIMMLIAFSVQSFAQGNDRLSDDIVKMRIREDVMMLNDYITLMSDKRESNTHRMQYRKAALELFIAQGDSVVMANGSKNKSAMIESNTSKNGHIVKNTRPVRVFFSRLVQLVEQGMEMDIQIESGTVYLLDETSARKINDSLFLCNFKLYELIGLLRKNDIP